MRVFSAIYGDVQTIIIAKDFCAARRAAIHSFCATHGVVVPSKVAIVDNELAGWTEPRREIELANDYFRQKRESWVQRASA